MKVSFAGLLSLFLMGSGVGSATVVPAPESAIVRTLPGHVFAWSAGGAQLAFAEGRNLWVVSPDDWHDGRQFTFEAWDSDGAIEQLVWAPDGKTLAVVAPRNLDQWQSIWLVDMQSGALVDLLPPEVSDRFGSPGIRAVRIGAWLDAGTLAFVQRCGTGCVAVHRVAVEPRIYAHYCVAGADGDFAWDPAGTWAVFGGHLGALGYIDLQRASDEPWQDCNISLPAYDPQSPVRDWYTFEATAADGRKVLLRRYSDSGMAAGLAIWDFQGLPTDLVSDGVHAAWSPDSRRIAVVRLARTRPHDNPETLDAELQLLDGTGDVRVLAHLGSVESGNPEEDWLARPTWSPDGRKLTAQDREGRVLMLQPDIAPGPRVLLVGERARAAWSADAQWLIVQMADGGVPEIGTPYLLQVGDAKP